MTGMVEYNIARPFGPIRDQITGIGTKFRAQKTPPWRRVSSPDAIGRVFERSTCLSMFRSHMSFAAQPAARSMKLEDSARKIFTAGFPGYEAKIDAYEHGQKTSQPPIGLSKRPSLQ